jgi:hypothetical protein
MTTAKFLKFSLVLILTLAVSHLASTAQAQAACSKTWKEPVSGYWGDPNRWTPYGVPEQTDDVCITLDGTYTVTVYGPNANPERRANTVTLGSDQNTHKQTLWVRGGVTNHAGLTALNGFTNRASGIVKLESDPGALQSNLSVPAGSLDNLGVIDVNTGAGGLRNIYAANFVNWGPGVLNVNQTLSLGQANGVTINFGAINIAAGKTLGFSSRSIFHQTDGSLVISGTLAMDVDTFVFNGGAISGTPHLRASTLELNTANPASFILAGSGVSGGSTLVGDVAEGQELWIRGDGSHATLTAPEGFTNAGTIRLESASGLQSNLAVTSGTLVNTGAIYVNQGGGGLRNITAELENHGTLWVTHHLALSKNQALHVNESTGIIHIGWGTTLTVGGTNSVFRNEGIIGGGGTLTLSNIFFFGIGDIVANVNNNGGAFNPGLSPGSLHIVGTYNQSSGAELNSELGGADPGAGFDQITVDGTANLAGAMNVSLVNGFVPEPCQRFPVLNATTRSGTFTIYGLDLGGGLFLRPRYTPASLALIAYSQSAAVNVHPTEISLAEGGSAVTYDVCLSRQPTSDVTVTLFPDGQVQVSPAMLVFTPADWEEPKTVTVSAVDDAIYEVAHNGIIHHSVSSGDAYFNGSAVANVAVSISDNDSANQPPVAEAGPDQAVACAGPDGAVVSLDGTASSDPDGDSLTFAWSAPGISFDDPTSPTPTAMFPMGESTVTLVVNDGMVDSAPDTLTITVQDTTPAALAVAADPASLWPPNHKHVSIGLPIEVSDLCDAAPKATAVVYSSEPDDAEGDEDGSTTGDIRVTTFAGDVLLSSNAQPQVAFDPIHDGLEVRSERSANGQGREYIIIVTVTDRRGNQATATAKVVVPHDNKEEK